MKREEFKSRLGFLLVSAGCAIGIGNVWKFPYITGLYGGGIFVIVYLLFLVIMGVPVLSMELAVGRASRRSAVLGYKLLEPKGSKWHWHGFMAMAGVYLLMMYYTTVCGWMLSYFVKFATGKFMSGMNADAVGGVFGEMLGNPAELTIFMVIAVAMGFLTCAGGLRNGVEKITKVMMVALFILIAILAVHSMTLENAKEGLSYYLLPSLDKVRAVGLAAGADASNDAAVLMKGFGQVVTAAMNQAFFTLSLGVGAMEIFGSYMDREHTLASESRNICILDTFVALMSGLIIFPACASFGVQPDAGPSLIFITLPNVFINMTGGRIWGALFFIFMTFASLSTVIAVFEQIVAFYMDMFGWKRNKSIVMNFILMIILGMPCVLGFNVLSGFQPLGPGSGVLDLEDFIVSNLLLPIGSIVYLLFCVSKWGWGFDKYLGEANTGVGMKMSPKLKFYFRWVLPVLILIILIQGL